MSNFEQVAKAYYNANPKASQREGARHIAELLGWGEGKARHNLRALFKDQEPWLGLWAPEQQLEQHEEGAAPEQQLEQHEEGAAPEQLNEVQRARCSRCGFTASTPEEVRTLFGVRKMRLKSGLLRAYPQSKCRACTHK